MFRRVLTRQGMLPSLSRGYEAVNSFNVYLVFVLLTVDITHWVPNRTPAHACSSCSFNS